MNSGIVMEINKKHIIVMTPEGRFDRIPAKNRSCQVGEEISFVPRHFRYRYPAFSTLSVFAAAVMFCMILFSTLPGLFADKTVVAYVSIDINPSVEAGIDGKNIVREARGLNDQGNQLIGSLKLKGKTIAEFTETLLRQAENKQYLKDGEGDIIIASTVVSDGAKVDDSLLSENLKHQVLTHFVMEYPDQTPAVQVTAFAAPKEVREEAKNQGLSLGKYAIYLGAKSTGHDLKLDDFKTDSVHTIAKENGGIDKLVDGSKLKKDGIKELLQGEKDGTLDKLVQEQKKKKEEESKKQGKANTKTVNPSQKPGPSASETPKPTPAASKAQQKSNESSRARDIKKQDPNDNEKKEQDDGRKDTVRQDEKKDNEKKNIDSKDNKSDISASEAKGQNTVKAVNPSDSNNIEEKNEDKQDRASRGDHEKGPKKER